MYVVVHGELTHGQQLAQSAHAVADVAVKFPQRFRDWHTSSQYIVVLQTQDSSALEKLLHRAYEKDIEVAAFREPDLGDELTSLAFPPCCHVGTLLANLPLAGRKR